jgi:8-oxo-dGTP pyrophosphatase MutT (NUDIX family)
MHPIKLKHQLTTNVKLLHKAALVYQGKVLILKRASDANSRPGRWDLAGGNSEWPAGATNNLFNPHQADISREIMEETGFDIPKTNFSINNLVYFATYFEAEREIFSVNCGWAVYLDKLLADQNPFSIVEISSEHTDYQWITLDELNQFDFGGPSRDYETAIIRSVLK